MVVAIDGPAGAGKSSVARALADKVGFRYLDSGAMYRAVAKSLVDDPGSPGERARDVKIELGDRVLLDGRDVSDEIRTPEVSEAASKIATDPRVRAALVVKQREIVQSGDWVAEGRDIGTVVAQEAELKIYLTASPEERARRRAAPWARACASSGPRSTTRTPKTRSATTPSLPARDWSRHLPGRNIGREGGDEWSSSVLCSCWSELCSSSPRLTSPRAFSERSAACRSPVARPWR